MKNLIFSLLVLSVSFAACKKDPTFDDKLVGKWVSTNLKIKGVDVTSTNTVTLNIQSSHEFDADVTTKVVIGDPIVSSYTGVWTADEVKEDIVLKYDNNSEEKYDITSLTETTMKATVVVNSERREFVFEKNVQ